MLLLIAINIIINYILREVRVSHKAIDVKQIGFSPNAHRVNAMAIQDVLACSISLL